MICDECGLPVEICNAKAMVVAAVEKHGRDAVFAVIDPSPALGAEAMREAVQKAVASVAGWSPYVAGSPESKAWVEGGISAMKEVGTAIRALPLPSEADLDRAALARPKVAALRTAAKRGLNFIENTENEMGCTLESGEMLRAALAALEATRAKGGAK